MTDPTTPAQSNAHTKLSIAELDGFGYCRENSGAFVLVEGERGTDEYNRVGTVDLTIKPKRGEGYKTDDPKALARAEFMVRAWNSHAALVEALTETKREAEEHLKNIAEAKASGFQDLDNPVFRDVYDKETARMEAIIARARAALRLSQQKGGDDV